MLVFMNCILYAHAYRYEFISLYLSSQMRLKCSKFQTYVQREKAIIYKMRKVLISSI